MKTLDEKSLKKGVKSLISQSEPFRKIYDQFGYPPLWKREPGFPTLIHIILEQQVSLASAQAAFDKLGEAVPGGKITPATFLKMDDAALKSCGFSRQKTRYGRELANAILDGSLDIDTLVDNDDDEDVLTQLTQVKGDRKSVV